jgi:neutral ceramidase
MIAEASPTGPTRALLIGLANNYLSYVPTRLEYQTQHYEGGSTLYGPASAEVYTRQLAELTRELELAGWKSPHVNVPPFPSFPGPAAEIVSLPSGPGPPRAPQNLQLRMEGDYPVLRWRDLNSSWIIPRLPNVVAVEQRVNGTWVPHRWDGGLDLEVRQVKLRRNDQADWQARWMRSAGERGTFRFRLVGTSETLEFEVP